MSKTDEDLNKEWIANGGRSLEKFLHTEMLTYYKINKNVNFGTAFSYRQYS